MNFKSRSIVFAIVASVFAFSSVSCVKQEIEPELRRDTDAINIAYNEGATATVTVRYNGQWYASSEEDWLTVSPDASSPLTGDGSQFQSVTITAKRNISVERKGKIRISSANGQYNSEVEVTQADGRFSIDKPSLSGVLTKGENANAAIVVKYAKALGKESIDVSASIAGDPGLSVTPTNYKVPGEGDGSVSLSISGVPVSYGDIAISVNVKVDGNDYYTEELKVNVLSPDIIFIQTFDNMIFGGDYPNNQKGIGVDGGQTYEWDAPQDRWMENKNYDADGVRDAFGDSDSNWKDRNIKGYRESRGLSGWSGSKCYEHPGYMKVGTGSAAGWFMLPALSSLKSESTVTLTMKLLRFDNTDGTIEVTAEGAGSVVGGVLTPDNFPAQTKPEDRKWSVRTFRIDGATSETRIKVSALNSPNVKTTRFNVDSIVVSTSVLQLTEPLKSVEASEITTYPTENSIEVRWNKVEGADAYSVVLYSELYPGFKYTQETDTEKCLFESIPSGAYVLEITAISYVQPEYNSETVVKKIGTAGYVMEKLAAPTGLTAKVDGRNLSFSWDAVSGGSLYKALLYKQGVEESVDILYSNTTSARFETLDFGEYYKVSVQAVVSKDAPSEFDSEAVESDYLYIELPVLKAEIVFVNESQYGIKWSLQDYKDFDFDYATTYTLATYKDEACTDLHSKFYFNANQSIFNSKYCMPYQESPRFMVSALESDKDYWVKVSATSFGIEKTVKVHTEVSKVVSIPSAVASAGDVILYEDFSEWTFGGEAIYGMPSWGLAKTSTKIDAEYYNALGDDPLTLSGSKINYCEPKQHSGLMNTFKWHVPDTRIKDWGAINEDEKEGALCMQSGAVKIGASNKCAQIVTPAITCLSGAAEVEVSFDACPYRNPDNMPTIVYDPATVIVQVYNNSARQDEAKYINHEVGTPSETEVHKFRLPTESDSDYKWVRYTYTVTVNNGDAIGLGSYRDPADSEDSNKQRRLYIDNIQLKVVNYK